MDGLTGKVAIVTGGAKGIGAATARGLVAAGGRALIADIDIEAGEALASELGEAAEFAATDVTDDAAIAACVGRAEAAFGGIDGLVNGAVVFKDDGLDSTRERWLAGFDCNIVGPAHRLEAAAPARRRRGGGAVVNFSSIAAKFGQRGRGVYPATKAAIRQLSRNQAMHYSADRIRVNLVSPAWTWTTPIIEAAGGDRAKADRVAADYHPLGRVADAEEVAAAVLFLLSDNARFITGIDLPVDGGYAISGPDQGTPTQYRLSE